MSSELGNSNKFHKAALLLRSPLLSFRRYQNLFLISHMRARTSLLSHIMGSHAEIAGYYEQHIAHWKRASDLRLRASLLEERLITPDTRYLLDKVLHVHLDPPPEAPAVGLFCYGSRKRRFKALFGWGWSGTQNGRTNRRL